MASSACSSTQNPPKKAPNVTYIDLTSDEASPQQHHAIINTTLALTICWDQCYTLCCLSTVRTRDDSVVWSSMVKTVRAIKILGVVWYKGREDFVSFRKMITSQLQGKLWLYDEVRTRHCLFCHHQIGEDCWDSRFDESK
ncbi:hypothetical protein Tco_1214005 [Tanacetum coccineum]